MITVQRVTDAEKYVDGVVAVVFDLDDTLYGEKSYVRSGYKKIAQAFPAIENAAEKLWERFVRGEKAIDAVLESEGAFSPENLEKCVRIYRTQTPEIALYDGVEQMLRRMKASGKKLGLITDGRPEGQRAKLRALRLDELFDEIIVTDELGGVAYRKPCEKAFELMCERLGVAAGKCVYIGDNPRKDFIAPQKLGMKSIYFKNSDGLYYEP